MTHPLIKYAGGKFKEYDCFKGYIPDNINNYYEPFFGGGGVFFRLMNDKKISGMSFGNDISTDLILFYNSITDKGTLDSFYCLSNDWEKIKRVGLILFDKVGYLFHSIIIKDKVKESLTYDEIFSNVSAVLGKRDNKICIDTHNYSLAEFISREIESKLNRFLRKEIDSRNVTLEITKQCISTAVCQGFYFIIRRMYNDILLGSKDYTEKERCTYWLFIRCTCYGGMFRFSRDGLFNIPYGGKSYNTRAIKDTIDYINTDEVRDILKKIEFSEQDFKEFMDRDYGENDFIFLDPPYDSDFSEYDNHPFGKSEHILLRDTLKEIKCKWLMVIRKTDFIDDLYKNFNKYEFEKRYTFQTRGTYDAKNSIHLIISNYDKTN